MTRNMVPWSARESTAISPSEERPDVIAGAAIALRSREQALIIRAFETDLYELAADFTWDRTMARLKVSIGKLGMAFVGEMIGRDDISDHDAPANVLTDYEAIRLAESLGVITATGALRLRQGLESLAHFRGMTGEDDAAVPALQMTEVLDRTEAIGIVKNCVRYVLAEQDFGAAMDFQKLRNRLLSEQLSVHDSDVQALLVSPAFFQKTTLRVLLSEIKSETGAKLERAITNFVTLLPPLWIKVGDKEKWDVGLAYSELASAGKTLAVNGIRQALLQVKGFDFVPENLRSNTFKRAAEAVTQAHFDFDNFYTEVPVIKHLVSLGTTIPRPALIECLLAYLYVYCGNRYGYSFGAAPIAYEQLTRVSLDQWHYFLNKALPEDTRLLEKLLQDGPLERFRGLMEQVKPDPGQISRPEVVRILDALQNRRAPRKHVLDLIAAQKGTHYSSAIASD